MKCTVVKNDIIAQFRCLASAISDLHVEVIEGLWRVLWKMCIEIFKLGLVTKS